MRSEFDTIAALSTPPGESGIAVVRMSGPDALAVLSRVFRATEAGASTGDWEHRRLYRGDFVDAGGDRVDDVMVAVMRGPATYTGEDVVEFNCHGSTVVVARVLETLFGSGVRPAEPGEFTRRAFLHGKMDLIQAEAVADLIHARSEIQRVAAERQLAGGLSRRIDVLADQMLVLLGTLEANIDFVEEDIDLVDVPAALAVIAGQEEELSALLASAPMSRPLRDGFRVVLAGPVNAGKSSLFNRLVGESRAIVTEIPGTTRDVLREAVVVDGVPFLFHDTAGLRQGVTDRVEAIGVDRAESALQLADVVLFVLDASEAGGADENARRGLRELDAARSIVVLNKTDLPAGLDLAASRPDLPRARVSATTGAGIDALWSEIRRLSGSDAMARMARDRAILNARLAGLLADARVLLRELAGMLADGGTLELSAQRAREVLSLYEEATGRRYQEGLLDTIFSRFCIGK